MEQRFWEIDFLRGTAIAAMILFHILVDLEFFGIYQADVWHGFWRWFGLLTASTFILLAGASLAISNRKHDWKRHVSRGLELFGLGMVATLVTWLFLGSGFVVFGILHFIGLSVILGILFTRFKFTNILLGAAAIMFGLYLQGLATEGPWLLWLGLMPMGFYSVDYFPLLPWFGIFLFGIAFGNAFYPKGKRAFRIPDLAKNFFAKYVCFLGRHSLLIYLVHQLIIVAILWLIF